MIIISTFYSIMDHKGAEPCDTRHGNNRNGLLIMRNGNNRKSITFRSLPVSMPRWCWVAAAMWLQIE